MDENDSYISLFWGVRKNDLVDCVILVQATFSFLGTYNSSFRSWYRTSRPQKGKAVLPILSTEDEIESLLLGGRNYNDVGDLLRDLGYSFYLKSCPDFSKANVLSINCAVVTERISNSVVLMIGHGEMYDTLIKGDSLKHIYSELAKIWNPERGVIVQNYNEVFR